MAADERVFAIGVRFDQDRLYVTLANGFEISAPLAAFPRLRGATAEQLRDYVIEERGTGIHWPEVDEDIGVAYLLGVPEGVLEDLVGL